MPIMISSGFLSLNVCAKMYIHIFCKFLIVCILTDMVEHYERVREYYLSNLSIQTNIVSPNGLI